MNSEGHGNHVHDGRAGGPWAPGLAGLEQQQALLLNKLRRAAGAPVSYAELRDAGIEFPAGVVFELELAGIPIRRCHGGAAGAQHAPAVRLEVADDPGRQEPATEGVHTPTDVSGWDQVRVYRTATGGALLLSALDWLSRTAGAGRRAGAAALRAVATPREAGAPPAVTQQAVTQQAVTQQAKPVVPAARPRRVRMSHTAGRWLALAALLATIAVVSAFVLNGLSGGGGRGRGPVAHRASPKTAASSRGVRASTGVGAGHLSPTRASPGLATNLEARGHSLLATGRYGDAVPVLRRAVRATGERTSACVEPDSSTCLTYAYALYDLGRALRLSGNAAAAVPILEGRLRIDNQRTTVQAELRLARQGIT